MDRKHMLPEPFSLAREVADGVVRIRLVGELDIATAPILETELEQATEEAIVLDLGELTFIDVAGLHEVLSAESRARATHQKLTLVDGSVPVRKMFQLTGNEHLLDGKKSSGDDG